MLREGSVRSKVTQLPSGRVLHPACGLYWSPQRSLREGWVTAPPLTAGDVGVLCTSSPVLSVLKQRRGLKVASEPFSPFLQASPPSTGRNSS